MPNWPNLALRTGPTIEQKCPERLHPMWPMRAPRWKPWAGFSGAILAIIPAACSVGPDYLRPPAPEPAAYKELKGWKRATPRDDIDRGPWWSAFRDKYLDSLEPQVEISNQNVAAAEAAYRQSLAVIKETQAGLFPVVTVSYSETRSHFGPRAIGDPLGAGVTRNIFRLAANGIWDLDLWGKIRRTIESNVAGAQASAADLANAKLSTQSLLATAYYNLRAADALQALLDRTVVAFKRTLEITENQHKAGTVSKADVANALAQVLNTQAQAIAVGIQRAQFEHAIAALMGRPPEDLKIAPTPLGYKLPDVPVSVPSALLERRPDIASAERKMQQQNALIGANIALYYPNVSLTGMFGFTGRGGLAFAFANEFSRLAASATQTIFNAGLISAQVEAAIAAYDQSVATYRQTVLTAFQQVEDQLAAVRILARQQRVADEAVKAAREGLDILLNQYQAGTVAFTAVVVAQTTLLASEQSALTVRQNRFLAAIALIQALGGGWDSGALPGGLELESRNNPLIPPI